MLLLTADHAVWRSNGDLLSMIQMKQRLDVLQSFPSFSLSFFGELSMPPFITPLILLGKPRALSPMERESVKAPNSSLIELGDEKWFPSHFLDIWHQFERIPHHPHPPPLPMPLCERRDLQETFATQNIPETKTFALPLFYDHCRFSTERAPSSTVSTLFMPSSLPTLPHTNSQKYINIFIIPVLKWTILNECVNQRFFF